MEAAFTYGEGLDEESWLQVGSPVSEGPPALTRWIAVAAAAGVDELAVVDKNKSEARRTAVLFVFVRHQPPVPPRTTASSRPGGHER